MLDTGCWILNLIFNIFLYALCAFVVIDLPLQNYHIIPVNNLIV